MKTHQVFLTPSYDTLMYIYVLDKFIQDSSVYIIPEKKEFRFYTNENI